jgi:hypothetical protein
VQPIWGEEEAGARYDVTGRKLIWQYDSGDMPHKKGIKMKHTNIRRAVALLALLATLLAAAGCTGARAGYKADPSPSPSSEPSPSPTQTPVLDAITIKIPGNDAEFTLKNVAAEYWKTSSPNGGYDVYYFVFFGDDAGFSCDTAANISWYYSLMTRNWTEEEEAASPRRGNLEYDGPWSVGFPDEWRGTDGKFMSTYDIAVYETGLLGIPFDGLPHITGDTVAHVTFQFFYNSDGIAFSADLDGVRPVAELAVG